MSSANVDLLQEAKTQVTNLYTFRYVSLAGTSVLKYDTLLTLPQELYFVWSSLFFLRRRDAPLKAFISRILYLLNRYVMITIAIINLLSIMPTRTMNNEWCRSMLLIVSRTDIWIEIVGSGVVLHRLYLLWNFGRSGTWILLSTFICSKTIALAFAYASTIKVRHSIAFEGSGSLRVCGIPEMPLVYLGAWIPAAAFDVFAFMLLLLNALSRPRVESERLLRILYSDGIIFLFTTFCMRALNVILVASATDPSIFYMGMVFSGTIVTTAASRAFLGLFKLADSTKSNDRGSGLVLEGDCVRDCFIPESHGPVQMELSDLPQKG